MYDARTGAAIYERVKLLNHVEHGRLQPGKAVVVYPSSLGGLNYSPSSFDPGTGYVINNQAETASVLMEKKNPAVTKRNKVRGDVDNGLANGSFGSKLAGWHDFGSVSASRRGNGEYRVEVRRTRKPGRGVVTTTASGIGFAGGGDGVLRAFDTKTGNVLWSFQTGYQLASGRNRSTRITARSTSPSLSVARRRPRSAPPSQLVVFALKGRATQPAPRCARPAPSRDTWRAGAVPVALRRPARSRTRSWPR